MFSSNSRRASTVSAAVVAAVNDPVFIGTRLHAADVIRSARSRPDESRLNDIGLFRISLRYVNRRRQHWRLRCALPRDDPLDNGEPARQIVPVHYQRRKNTERMLARRQRENTLVPSPLHDVTGRLKDVESPDEASSAYRANFPRAARNRIELLSEPRAILANRLEQRRVGEAL